MPMLPDNPTIGESTGYFLWFLSDLMFKWVPGVVTSVTGFGGSSVNTAPPAPGMPLITEPITVPQTVDFMQSHSAPGIYDTINQFWTDWVIIAIGVSLIFGVLVVYNLIRIVQIRRQEYRHFEAMQHTVAAHDVPRTHLRWKRVEDQAYGESDQGWRLAILEADIMLNELLDLQGYRGETMSDKMRQVERSKFNTIDLAWEAHRTRNKIAHEGSAHHLSGLETQRVIGLYEKVFREFKFID